MKTKETKRNEARIRQAACDALTPTQRLAKLDAKGHRAEKERAKLARKVGT